MNAIDSRLTNLLACPRDRTGLHVDGLHLRCAHGHYYPVVDGVPVLLLGEEEATLSVATASLKAAESGAGGPLYVDTLGIPDDLKCRVAQEWTADARVDAAISYLVGATSGHGYADSIGRLQDYPIPDIPVGPGSGELLLDVGSSWGRWSVSAARKGWSVVGLDPSLGAMLAARRAFSRLGLDMIFVCGDARFMPFKSELFGCVFSYSVIQHFSEADAKRALAETSRVLRHGGFAKVQMAHKGGLRATYSRTRSDYRRSGSFRVRYWSLAALREAFESKIGPSTLQAEAFGGLGLLPEDRQYVSTKAKALIALSAFLKKLSAYVLPLIRFADSIYVMSVKQ
ncbi:MAG TPA: methyltransferase domain-containing protein [Bradyrhizobium sp.]|nr:methyltransferase domain-containing protein [Bradyrhizobium sp.]